VSDDSVVIRWEEVTSTPPGFPNERIQIVGYQVLVDPFEVILPASSRQVTLPEEFVESLAAGRHPFEVLAIDASGNQTITEVRSRPVVVQGPGSGCREAARGRLLAARHGILAPVLRHGAPVDRPQRLNSSRLGQNAPGSCNDVKGRNS
jgi:hypothetical protein